MHEVNPKALVIGGVYEFTFEDPIKRVRLVGDADQGFKMIALEGRPGAVMWSEPNDEAMQMALDSGIYVYTGEHG